MQARTNARSSWIEERRSRHARLRGCARRSVAPEGRHRSSWCDRCRRCGRRTGRTGRLARLARPEPSDALRCGSSTDVSDDYVPRDQRGFTGTVAKSAAGDLPHRAIQRQGSTGSELRGSHRLGGQVCDSRPADRARALGDVMLHHRYGRRATSAVRRPAQLQCIASADGRLARSQSEDGCRELASGSASSCSNARQRSDASSALARHAARAAATARSPAAAAPRPRAAPLLRWPSRP